MFKGIGTGLLPIVPTDISFLVKPKNEKQYTVYRHQLALTAAYSFTHHKGQGQTLDYVIIDLADPPKHSLDVFHAYIALSHSCGRQTIRLLQGFNLDVLMTPPSPEVTVEDTGLAELHQKTKEKYERGEFNY